MNDIQIYQNDTWQVIANKIFYHFIKDQSCTITGMVIDEELETVHLKGELVIKELRRLDVLENFRSFGRKGMRRRRVELENCVGEFTNQKAFRYKIDTVNSQKRVSIWRIQ